MPHVREPEALVVAGEYPLAVRARDEGQRRPEAVVGVLECALGQVQRECRTDVLRGLDHTARLVERRAGLLDPPRGHEIVEQASQVPGAQSL